MKSPRSRRSSSKRGGRPPIGVKFSPARLRIVSGTLRGRKVEYNGDPATRPMKERTRESVFSMLGGKLNDTWAIDLFAGTGILAFESVSRGSQRAILFELSRPTLGTILDNMHKLGLEQQIEVHHADTLRVLRHLADTTLNWTQLPWIIFCCPPYRMWTEESDRICQGIAELYERCPVGSQFVCETDKSFDLAAALPKIAWDVRKYDPAFISIARKLNTVPEID